MDASIRSRSAILAIAFHIVLFLVLLFTFMKIQIPPFPEAGGGGGVLVNIGTYESAAGDEQPMSENITAQPVPEKVKAAPSHEEDVATQELEDASIASKKTDVKKTTPVKTETKPVKTEKIVVTPPKTADPRAIYRGKTTASQSQGTGTGKGDQGDSNGDPFSKYTGKNGTGGNGTGKGTGEGPGPGGPGKGIEFALSGRHMVRTPQISDQSQETGKVVVDITVDKDGNVATAVAGGRGSTTTSAYLFKLAKEAAMKAKFSSSPEADIQRGTMTFVFVVQ